MKKSHIYLALLALTALLMFFAACGEGTPVKLEGSDLKLINDSILAVEDRISDCFNRETDDDCADITMPGRRSSSSGGGSPSQPGGSSSGEETNPLTCTGLSQSGLAGVKITKPTVKCAGEDITATATFNSALDWTAPEEGDYIVTAIANCDGSQMAMATCGSIKIAAVEAGTLYCTGMPTTGVATEKIIPPTVRCGDDVVSSPIFDGAPTPSWNAPIAGTYEVSAKAPATGACKGAADKECGTIKVFPRLDCGDFTPTSVIAGTAVTPPIVTCGTGNTITANLIWNGQPLDWANPAAGEYKTIKVTAADCGDQTATCGSLTVNKKLTCNIGQTIEIGKAPSLTGKVKCGDDDLPTATNITWNPNVNTVQNSATTISNVTATAACDGKPQTADCEGSITVSANPVIYELTCASVPTTGTAGKAITKPKVTCTSTSNGTSTQNEVTNIATWSASSALNWANPAAGTYNNIKATADCGGSKTAACEGSITVSFELTCSYYHPPKTGTSVGNYTLQSLPNMTLTCRTENSSSSSSWAPTGTPTWSWAEQPIVNGKWNATGYYTGTITANCGAGATSGKGTCNFRITPAQTETCATPLITYPTVPEYSVPEDPYTACFQYKDGKCYVCKVQDESADNTCSSGWVWTGLYAVPGGGGWFQEVSCPSSTVSSSSAVPSSSSRLASSSSRIASSSSRIASSSSRIASSSSAVTYTLTCNLASTTGTAGVAITQPTVKCNDATLSSGFTFTNPPGSWNTPVAGTYNVSASASTGNCSGQTASCGTLTVAAAGGGGCAYQSSWCNGKYTTSSAVPTTVNTTTGSCFFVSGINSSSNNDINNNKVLINGAKDTSTKKDGGYYIYVSGDGLEGGTAWSFTTGSPSCQ